MPSMTHDEIIEAMARGMHESVWPGTPWEELREPVREHLLQRARVDFAKARSGIAAAIREYATELAATQEFVDGHFSAADFVESMGALVTALEETDQ